MTRTELSARLANLAGLAFGQLSSRFTDSTTAADIPRWDSLNHVKLLILIEDEFDLQFTGADLKDSANWGAFVDMIAAKLEVR